MAYDITPILDEMTQDADAMSAAVTFIDSVPALIQTAIDATIAEGATAASMHFIADAAAVLTAKRAAIIAAIAANTPTPPPAPTPPTPVMATFKK